MKITIIGLGLIGGSFGLALRRLTGYETIGYDKNTDHRQSADKLGLVNKTVDSVDEAIRDADLIILSVPVDSIESLVLETLDKISPNQYVVDFGSTKESICQAVKKHPRRRNFLAAHPIAGTEHSGPGAAIENLFQDKVMILCEEKSTSKGLVQLFRGLCADMHMKVSMLSAKDHDRHLGYVSNLSHAISFALSNAVQGAEKTDKRLLELAGSGFESTVRLAKSSPEMWTPIFLKNKEYVLESLHNFSNEIHEIMNFVEEEDSKGLETYLTNGRKIRKILR